MSSSSEDSRRAIPIRLDSTPNPHAATAERLTRLETLFSHHVQAIGVLEHVQNARPLIEQIQGPPDVVADLHQLQEIVDNMKASIDALQASVATLQSNTAGTSVRQPLFRVPEPRTYSGVRDATVIRSFLWDLEKYFATARVPESEQVAITSLFLVDTAKLWWQTREADPTKDVVRSFRHMKEELMEQFLPKNSAWMARESLKRLEQTGTVREYVNQFSAILLNIPNMSEEDKLFNFLSGLKKWARIELMRQNPKDVREAYSMAERLTDLQSSAPPTPERKSVPSKNKGKSWNDKPKKKDGAVGKPKDFSVKCYN